MLKRFVILGLVLLLAGSAALVWVLAEKRKEQEQTAHYGSKYGSQEGLEPGQYDEWLPAPGGPAGKQGRLPPALDEQAKIKTKAELRQEQQKRLKADLDKLAGGESDAPALADFLYGENWQEELKKYKRQKEQKELIFNGSIVCMSIGGTVFTACLLLYTARLLVRASCGLGRLLTDARKARGQRLEDRGQESVIALQAPQVQLAQCPDAQQVQASVLAQALVPGAPATSGRANQSAQPRLKSGADQSKKPLKSLAKVSRQDFHQDSVSHPRSCLRQEDAGATTQTTLRSISLGPRGRGTPATEAGAKALAEADPLNNTLVELTQQVAAIREYASTQQDRVQKLQEGYDWNIVRNFCLRVIHCIDNVENRIRERAGQNGEAAYLQEIRDELLFALESSGIEQFEPEINSDYRGQEKHTEAIKERELCGAPDLVGKIAKVVRPGYHYYIDDQNVKIVRPAMVMLFG